MFPTFFLQHTEIDSCSFRQSYPHEVIKQTPLCFHPLAKSSRCHHSGQVWKKILNHFQIVQMIPSLVSTGHYPFPQKVVY